MAPGGRAWHGVPWVHVPANCLRTCCALSSSSLGTVATAATCRPGQVGCSLLAHMSRPAVLACVFAGLKDHVYPSFS